MAKINTLYYYIILETIRKYSNTIFYNIIIIFKRKKYLGFLIFVLYKTCQISLQISFILSEFRAKLPITKNKENKNLEGISWFLFFFPKNYFLKELQFFKYVKKM